MSDGERSLLGSELCETTLNQRLGLGIDVARRFVEEEDHRVFQNGARECDPLALSP